MSHTGQACGYLIPLVCGGYAIVDKEEVSRLKKFKWRIEGKGKWRYVVTHRDGKAYRMHRLITGATKGMVVDHIDGNTLNNRKSNLRVCTNAENLRNQHSVRGRSKFKGVYFNKVEKLWRAQIMVNRKKICIGKFATPRTAAKAYDQAAKKYFGEFARLNFDGGSL